MRELVWILYTILLSFERAPLSLTRNGVRHGVILEQYSSMSSPPPKRVWLFVVFVLSSDMEDRSYPPYCPAVPSLLRMYLNHGLQTKERQRRRIFKRRENQRRAILTAHLRIKTTCSPVPIWEASSHTSELVSLPRNPSESSWVSKCYYRKENIDD